MIWDDNSSQIEITLLPELTACLIKGATFSNEEEVAIMTTSTFP